MNDSDHLSEEERDPSSWKSLDPYENSPAGLADYLLARWRTLSGSLHLAIRDWTAERDFLLNLHDGEYADDFDGAIAHMQAIVADLDSHWVHLDGSPVGPVLPK